MPIETGKRYILINKKSDKAVDLDIRDNKTVQCWTLHHGGNQQWDFTQVDGGWHIQNVQERDAYLNFEGDDTYDGKKVEGLPGKRLWHIWPDKYVPDGYRICVPNTVQNLDLSEHGSDADGTIVQLWSKWEPGENQVWTVKEVNQY